jgi:hypothetical protein
VLFLLLRVGLGAQQASLLALLLTAVGNTAANRRLTFGLRGTRGLAHHHLQGLVVFGLGLALTSGSLALVYAFGAPGRVVELAVPHREPGGDPCCGPALAWLGVPGAGARRGGMMLGWRGRHGR